MSVHPVEVELIFETQSHRTTVMSKVGDKAENYHPIRKIYGWILWTILGIMTILAETNSKT